MKVTKICVIALVFFPVALALESAAAKGNCSRKVVTATLQEELGKDQKPMSRDISDVVKRCKVMERASVANDRCSADVAHASLLAEGIENPAQKQITDRMNGCKDARDTRRERRKAAATDRRCSAVAVRAGLVEEGIVNPTQREVTDGMRSCKADEYYRKKIREAESSLEKPNSGKSRQARMKALVKTIDTLSKLRQEWLKPVNEDWDTGPLIPRGN